MGIENDLMNCVNNITNSYTEVLRKKLLKAAEIANDDTWEEFTKTADIDLRNIFKKVIDNFYDDFAAKHYQRSKSMYKLLDIIINDDDMVLSFYPEKMSSFERGLPNSETTGLYFLTFKLGYHGGGYKGKIPYYRKPINHWRYWSRPAEESDSPYFDIKYEVEKYWESYNKTYTEIFKRKCQEQISKIGGIY